MVKHLTVLNVTASAEYLPVYQTPNVALIVLIISGMFTLAFVSGYLLDRRRFPVTKEYMLFEVVGSLFCIIILSSIVVIDERLNLAKDNTSNSIENVQNKYDVTEVSYEGVKDDSGSYEIRFMKDSKEQYGIVTFENETSEPKLTPKDYGTGFDID